MCYQFYQIFLIWQWFMDNLDFSPYSITLPFSHQNLQQKHLWKLTKKILGKTFRLKWVIITFNFKTCQPIKINVWCFPTSFKAPLVCRFNRFCGKLSVLVSTALSRARACCFHSLPVFLFRYIWLFLSCCFHYICLFLWFKIEVVGGSVIFW